MDPVVGSDGVIYSDDGRVKLYRFGVPDAVHSGFVCPFYRPCWKDDRQALQLRCGMPFSCRYSSGPSVRWPTRSSLVLNPVNWWSWGGAALVLLYGARESTKDVDALIIGPRSADDVRVAARQVGETLGLPADWLNDAAKGYVHGLALGAIILDTPHLRIRTLAPEQLLAMKLSAWCEDVDIEDARLLLSKLHGDRNDIWHLIEPYVVPGRELKATYAFADLWEAQHGTT